MTVNPEPIAPADFREVAQLWYDSWLSTGAEHGEGVTVSHLSERLVDEGWEIFIVREESTIVAFLALDIESAILSQIFVLPSHQGAGIGVSLLEFAKTRLPSGMALRTNVDNRGARRFYEREGWSLDRIESGRAYYRWKP
ncbi:GNAT family N-acetyltransferase [Parasphingopyxis sp.]|uniref:GNAT family N-acetyltransferase n=1 Tax=Parasphingopyxis sp. TaxID=1920299 RepID=UPI002622A76B|nr:GNAT family N-acetyltransferase [Parasphingopyxis sp.]